MLEYRALAAEEITPALFDGFVRRQEVTLCRRYYGGTWHTVEDIFVDDWDAADICFLCKCLQNTVRTGGAVFGAFSSTQLKGFASVEAARFGSRGQYIELSALHVSREARHGGIGRALLAQAAAFARSQGAKALYASTQSSVETQRFYAAMGCVPAEEPSAAHVTKEPCDVQLQLAL